MQIGGRICVGMGGGGLVGRIIDFLYIENSIEGKKVYGRVSDPPSPSSIKLGSLRYPLPYPATFPTPVSLPLPHVLGHIYTASIPHDPSLYVQGTG